MLAIRFGKAGRDTVVLLDGVDVSRYLSRVELDVDVHGSRATLHYQGAVTVEGEPGTLALVRADATPDPTAPTIPSWRSFP